MYIITESNSENNSIGMWKINSTLEEWETVAAELESELYDRGFSDKFIISLMLATDEVFANISAYAYGDSTGNVTIKSEYIQNSDMRTAKISFADSGKRFDPLSESPEPDISSKNASMRQTGGLGIFIAKKQTDEMFYSYTDSQNTLTLLKNEII